MGAFTALQPGLLWNEAAYHCFVTMTTVGYGDVGMTTQVPPTPNPQPPAPNPWPLTPGPWPLTPDP